MARMANEDYIESFVYDLLSFLDYDCIVLVWTPSGSCPLCLTPPCYQLQKPPETAALFLPSHRLETINVVAAGLTAVTAQ